ncbi:MAG: Rap1a/Tai family immunity protein [Polaromonas sp.]|nr:Rap1a/Tai family immunity protein [Polaromonas sp.]
MKALLAKTSRIAVSVLAMMVCANVYSDSLPNAGHVHLDCSLAKAGAANRGDLCSFAIWGFVAGYLQGADAGAAAALIHDPAAVQTSRGIDDLTRKLEALKPRARCIPASAGVPDVVDAFTKYVEAHPEASGKPFGLVAAQAVAVRYGCGS